ncbi:hypothetical protein [Rickettsiella endosymbiont of Xylota segnis]|uniref:hypothetical protein n=1 Tax=Rickettsiella endosymbiont of Xylota segnis TaxID=3066238 RepID=UPI0030CD53D1
MSENLIIENNPKPEKSIESNSSIPIEKTIPPVIENVVEKTKYQTYEQDKLAPQPINPPATQASTSLTTEDVQNLIANHTVQQANEWQAQQIAQQFLGKLTAAKDKYPDFEETIANLEVHKFPEVVQLANNYDNTADIMYELGKNPSKAVILKQLAQLNPKMGALEIQRLSDSIKQNQAAKQGPIAHPPLSQLSPSLTKIDNGPVTVSDYRNQAWLRA